jgi:hypothetical protein
VEQIVESYGARWTIDSGFKEIKQEIGSPKSQTRRADAVSHHLSFGMMATTLTWIYAARARRPARINAARARRPARINAVSRTPFIASAVRRDQRRRYQRT